MKPWKYTVTGILVILIPLVVLGAYYGQDLGPNDSPTFVTTKLSALTDGYMSYHIDDATGQANSPLKRTAATAVTLEANAIGATPLDTNGLRLSNATAAAAGAQQYSPPVVQEGQGWETNVGSSMKVEFLQDVRPVQGAAAPSGYWGIYPSVNDAAYSATPAMSVASSGNVGIGTAAPASKLDILGAAPQLRLTSNLTDDTTKEAKLVIPHYDTDEENIMAMYAYSNATKNSIILGGGSASQNAATEIVFMTGATQTTTSGTAHMTIDSSGEVGIGTTAPDKAIEINSSTGANLRLTYNDGDGSAANYMDLSTTSTGNLTIGGSGGAVTKPNNPAFLAYNSVTDENVTGDGTQVTVEFNSEIFDQGSDFNSTTDTFTAPVTGKYYLSTNVSIEDVGGFGGTHVAVRICTSNATYYTWASAADGAGDCSAQLSVLADMDANDTAYVYVLGSAGTKTLDVTGTTYQTIFSGWLAN